MSKRYWFYGSMPTDTIEESQLTQEQRKIVELENRRIDEDNYKYSWLGYKTNQGWDFMRHGLEVIHINEERGNIARSELKVIIDEKYGD